MRTRTGFGVLWSANLLSNLADGVAFVSMPLLAATLTEDPRLVAGLATVYALVRLCVALPIGAWVDRVDRRSLIILANCLRGVALLGFAVTLQFGLASLLGLYVVMGVVGTLESLADEAAVALLPTLVERDGLDSANSRVSTAQIVADDFAGPPLGGFLFTLCAAAPVFALGGLWAAAGLIALALPLRAGRSLGRARHPSGHVTRNTIFAEATAGIVWLARHRVVGALAVIGALASVSYMLPFSILVLFAEQRLDLDPTGFGLLLAASSVGGLVATAITPGLRRRLSYRSVITASLLLGALALAGLGSTRDPFLAGALLAIYVLHAVVWGICSRSLRQRLVPDALLGRVGAAIRVLSLAGLALGSLLGGVLGSIDLRFPVYAGAAGFLACSIIAARTLASAEPRESSAGPPDSSPGG